MTLGRVVFVFSSFVSSSARITVAPLECCAHFLLLDGPGVDTRDLVGVFFVVAGENAVVASCWLLGSDAHNDFLQTPLCFFYPCGPLNGLL